MADETAIGRIINAVPVSEAELLAFMARCEVAGDDTLPIIGTLYMNGFRLEAVDTLNELQAYFGEAGMVPVMREMSHLLDGTVPECQHRLHQFDLSYPAKSMLLQLAYDVAVFDRLKALCVELGQAKGVGDE